jgi:hypothetical protein
MSTAPAVTMQELEHEHPELLPARETLQVVYPGPGPVHIYPGGPMYPYPGPAHICPGGPMHHFPV